MSSAILLAKVVAAFTRAIRAMGYYDASHPVFEQTKNEAFSALSEAWQMRTIVTLGSAGRHLVIDEEGTTLQDEPSSALARRMFDSSIVAIRLHDVARASDLGELMKVLAESSEKVRQAGGVTALLELERVQGIDVIEVDFASLFAGNDADLSPLVGDDPVAELALKGVLRFKDEGQDERSEALSVSLEKLSTPESLGDFLDGLLEETESSARTGGETGTAPEWGHITGDDFADYATRAYLTNQEKLAAENKDSALAESATILSNALVRLSPDARFALLRRLAGGDTVESAGHEQAIRKLGEQMSDNQVVDAIASALVDKSSDSDTVRAIGNLLRRLRPVEQERKRLMDQIDEQMFAASKPIDGVLWQQLQSQALEERALGLLEMSMEKVKPQLIRAAQTRMRGRVPPVVGQDALFAFDDLSVARRATRAFSDVVAAPGRVGPGALKSVGTMIAQLHKQGDEEACLTLLAAMIRRADSDRSPALLKIVHALLRGERGARWSMLLLARADAEGSMVGDLILNALEAPGDREQQEALLARLAGFEPSALLRMGEQLADASPIRVHHLLRAALRFNPRVGLKIARVALKNPNLKAKEVALKALVDAPNNDSIALLAQAAGWKGEKQTVGLLNLKNDDGAHTHKLQMVAIGALGLSHAAAAVAPLVDLLAHQKLFESKDSEEIRLGAAQALLTNGTEEATAALEAHAKHKKKAIREVCARVLGNRKR